MQSGDFSNSVASSVFISWHSAAKRRFQKGRDRKGRDLSKLYISRAKMGTQSGVTPVEGSPRGHVYGGYCMPGAVLTLGAHD